MNESKDNILKSFLMMVYFKSVPVPSLILRKRRRYSNDITGFLIIVYLLKGVFYEDMKLLYSAAGWAAEKFQEVQDILLLSELMVKSGKFGKYHLTKKGEVLVRDVLKNMNRTIKEQLKIISR